MFGYLHSVIGKLKCLTNLTNKAFILAQEVDRTTADCIRYCILSNLYRFRKTVYGPRPLCSTQ